MANLPTLYTQHPTDLLILPGDSRTTTSRLHQYFQWCQETGQSWHDPDLAAYRDHLMARGVSPASAVSILSTIRGRYKWLLKQNWFKAMLIKAAETEFPHREPIILANEKLFMMGNAIDAENSPVEVTTVQDEEDQAFIRLTPAQASRLVQGVRGNTPDAIRDRFILGLLLATGIRAEELLNVEVDDLRQRYDGRLSLRIKRGKGNKKRMIPYGEMESVLALGDKWLQVAGITEGYVFRAIRKNKDKTGKPRVAAGRLSYSGLLHILGQYSVMVEGHPVTLNPHDYRRTYARIQYEAGVEELAIQENLGHENFATTRRYIGNLDGLRRAGKAYIDFGEVS